MCKVISALATVKLDKTDIPPKLCCQCSQPPIEVTASIVTIADSTVPLSFSATKKITRFFYSSLCIWLNAAYLNSFFHHQENLPYTNKNSFLECWNNRRWCHSYVCLLNIRLHLTKQESLSILTMQPIIQCFPFILNTKPAIPHCQSSIACISWKNAVITCSSMSCICDHEIFVLLVKNKVIQWCKSSA